MTNVCPIKAKIITHVDVLVKDLGLEHGNSVQTPFNTRRDIRG